MPNSKPETFKAFVSRERRRLGKERSAALKRRAQADKDIQNIDKELAAIGAYERTKHGQALKTTRKKKVRTRRVGVRQNVLAVIKKNREGIARAGIIEKLDARGDRSFESSISNALVALKKANLIDNLDGKYKVKAAKKSAPNAPKKGA